VFVVDESAFGPQFARDFFASEQLSGTLNEQQKHLEGLRIQLDEDALPAKFTCGGVCLKRTEAIAPGWLWFGHDFRSVYPIASANQSLKSMYNFS
jgi:hypothetical protein